MNGFQIKQIKRCKELFEFLNSWEQDFIESLDDLPEDDDLSDKQMHKLNDVDTKVCQKC